MKKGFTLAEVLIALGIIGVVAALTMPTLISKYKELVLKQQFKKVYSTLSNVLTKVYVDNDNNPYSCYYGLGSTYSECLQLKNALKSALNVVKVCENHALAGGCISSEMRGVNLVVGEQNSDESQEEVDKNNLGCLGFYDNYIKNINPAWVLADGTIIGFYGETFTKLFWVDVNGQKKPNKWGYDIFVFALYLNDAGNVKLQEGTCYRTEQGGKSFSEMIK